MVSSSAFSIASGTSGPKSLGLGVTTDGVFSVELFLFLFPLPFCVTGVMGIVHIAGVTGVVHVVGVAGPNSVASVTCPTHVTGVAGSIGVTAETGAVGGADVVSFLFFFLGVSHLSFLFPYGFLFLSFVPLGQ